MKLKEQFLKLILSVYDQISGLQNEDGRFVVPETGYVVYNQSAGYYFAVLYTYPSDGNPYYRNRQALEMAIKGWDYFSTQITDAGLTKIYTNGKYWTDAIDEWGCYYWINSMELLKPHLDEAKLQRWNECIERIVSAMAQHIDETAASQVYRNQLENNIVFNHFIWTVLCYYRYGMVNNDESICSRARAEMERIFQAQTPSGTWLEDGVPVVSYAEVTLLAASLFEIYDDLPLAQTAVHNGLQYLLSTIYPDFRKNECVDGRNRYSGDVSSFLAPTFWKYEAGRAYLTQGLKNMMVHQEKGGGLAKFLHGLVLVADLVCVLPADVELLETNIWDYVPRKTRMDELKTVILRESDWVITMTCMDPVGFDNRWIMERQNLLSVYHKRAGLLVGGGHSVSQPELSSFNIVSLGKLHFLHDKGILHQDDKGMSLVYGGRSCSISLTALNDNELKFVYRVEGMDCKDLIERAYVHFPLWVKPGMELRCADETIRIGETAFSHSIEANTPFIHNHAEFMLSKEAVVSYPHIPFNPYKRKQEKSFAQVFAVIRVELDWSEYECELTLRV